MDGSCRDDPALMTPDPPAGSPVTRLLRGSRCRTKWSPPVSPPLTTRRAPTPRASPKRARDSRAARVSVPFRRAVVSHGLLHGSTRLLLIVPPHEQDEHPS